MAVLSQVHLANIDYSMALEEYDTAERYYEVSKKITEQVNNAQKIARFGNSELISNNTEIKFTNEHSLRFDTTKDLKDDFTQFYKLAYKYETDCLSASFEYEKKFFSDGSLKPDESLYFLIRFIPFAELRGSADTIFE